MTTLDEINTLEQAAAYLCVKPATLTRLRLQGKIGFLKTGSTVTYLRGHLEEHVKANTVEAVVIPNPWGLAAPVKRGPHY